MGIEDKGPLMAHSLPFCCGIPGGEALSLLTIIENETGTLLSLIGVSGVQRLYQVQGPQTCDSSPEKKQRVMSQEFFDV